MFHAGAMIAVLGDDDGIAAGLPQWRAIGERANIWFAPADVSLDLLQDCRVVCTLRERMAISAEDLKRLPKLRLLTVVGQAANVDVQAARARGVEVGVLGGAVPSGLPTPGPVEHAWALILALAKHVLSMHTAMEAGAWRYQATTTLAGKRLGIVGLGRIGRRMAAIAKAFGMEVVAWSINLTDEDAKAAGVERMEKAALFETSDIVSVHYALGSRSNGLVGQPEFSAMKRGAFFINTSRGAVIDEAALIEALRAGRIGGAGLDVFAEEPLPAEHVLRRLPNVVLTPHAGYATREGLTRMYDATARYVADWLDRAG